MKDDGVFRINVREGVNVFFCPECGNKITVVVGPRKTGEVIPNDGDIFTFNILKEPTFVICSKCGNPTVVIPSAGQSAGRSEPAPERKLSRPGRGLTIESDVFTSYYFALLRVFSRFIPVIGAVILLTSLIPILADPYILAALSGLPSVVSFTTALSLFIFTLIRLVVGIIVLFFFTEKILIPYVSGRPDIAFRRDTFGGKLGFIIPLAVVLCILFFFAAGWGGLLLIPFVIPVFIGDWKILPRKKKSAGKTPNDTDMEVTSA